MGRTTHPTLVHSEAASRLNRLIQHPRINYLQTWQFGCRGISFLPACHILPLFSVTYLPFCACWLPFTFPPCLFRSRDAVTGRSTSGF